MISTPTDPEATAELLADNGYFAGRELTVPVFLSLSMQRPLLLEGEPGVGKTELARVLAAAFDAPLIRLQCYEGLDVSQSAYEWNVARQMLQIRLAQEKGQQAIDGDGGKTGSGLYTKEMLIERPLLAALSSPTRPVLLIDELDRADEPFEAFLLELLADYQLTIPELGTIKAKQPPIVVITSNRTREIHDALKRRCLYAWVNYPDAQRELGIVRSKVPGISDALSEQVVRFVQASRKIDLFKPAGIAETIDWANALEALNTTSLDRDRIQDTLGVLLKHQEDIERIRKEDIDSLLAQP